MRITIVCGFFLPVPPVSGGSTEKSWFRLARIFAARGHQVTLVSRRWPGWADDETVDGVRHLRLPGFGHRHRLWQNLVLDFIWSWRVCFALPAADIVVVNAVTLPAWLGVLRPAAGRIVLMTGRMPKGQYRHYRRAARILAASSTVRDRVAGENAALVPVMRVCGYPIDWSGLSRPPATTAPAPVVALGYIGRFHEEKGLGLLIEALEKLGAMPGLPPWRIVFCGPADIARGGSGPEFKSNLERRLSALLPPERFTLLEPQFDDRALADVYRQLDVFCYPSLAEQGETFGVAVAEAMAAGAVPVVSQLACFTDFVRDGENGLVFDHRAPTAAANLADALARLLRDTGLRSRLATAAHATARRYDFEDYAGMLLADFAQLTGPANPASSAP